MDLAAAAWEQRHMLGTSSHRMMDMGSPRVQGGMGGAGCCSPAQRLHSAGAPGQGTGPGGESDSGRAAQIRKGWGDSKPPCLLLPYSYSGSSTSQIQLP